MPDCVAAFPSVTPVCAASIVTGVGPGRAPDPGDELVPPRGGPLRRVRLELPRRPALRHRAPADRHRLQHEPRPPLAATRRPCSRRSTTPTCARPGTTYLMYRGRHRHEPQRDTALTRVASTLMRHPVMGPRELFYADIFASRRTGCRSGLGMPGVRDRHSGCVSRLPGRARPVRLPAAVAARQRLVLAQARPRRPGALDRPGRPAARARDATPPAGSTSSWPSTR